MKRVGGFRRKTRSKLPKNASERGRINISKYLQKFEKGDIVSLIADSSYQNGMYHPRFHGKTGEVIGEKGACYYISIADGGKMKKLIVHPVHLKRVKCQ